MPEHSRLAVAQEMGQEARRQKGSQCTQPPQTPGCLGQGGGEEGCEGNPLWGLDDSRRHVVISQSVTLSALQSKGTEISFVHVPWHLLLLFKGCKKTQGWGGWEVQERKLCLGKHTVSGCRCKGGN